MLISLRLRVRVPALTVELLALLYESQRVGTGRAGQGLLLCEEIGLFLENYVLMFRLRRHYLGAHMHLVIRGSC